ncbi:MAG TPA: M14 family zinc carboxypeptidase [Luteibaculaceae bacterium]|nr:M14 family zinc carboxypeptidase [Luteibaculaceae bacterium]
MLKKKIILLLSLFTAITTHASDSKTYDQVIQAYAQLAQTYPTLAKLNAEGKGDNGKPIYTFVIEPSVKKLGKAYVTFLVNNGIHAGEPDGIEASLAFAEEILKSPNLYPAVRFVFIPVYNVDGFSTQSCCTRANQDGPELQGFRANARNLDLNRDFIKADASNTKTFYRIFHQYKPQVFIDTHVSNGADYSYTMTLISSQKDKLSEPLRNLLTTVVEPKLYAEMKSVGFPMIPYVNTKAEIPDSGLVGFLETPRYSTGYTTLFHCLGFVAETHMLKPYPQRVAATKALLKAIADQCQKNTYAIINAVVESKSAEQAITQFPIQWALNERKSTPIVFQGYEAKYKPSEISGLSRLYYDRSAPYSKKIPFFNQYDAIKQAKKPKAFIIPQAWGEVIERLALNQVELRPIQSDSTIKVNATYIIDFKSPTYPYEGHYLHYGTRTRDTVLEMNFFKGDYLVYTKSNPVRFLMEVLSPEASDSYFNWNFFDAVVQQKEHYSDYVFEDLAVQILKENPKIKQELDRAKAQDEALRNSARKQLDFIYYRSPYYERSHRLYPIFKIY